VGKHITPAGKERRDTPRVPIALHAIVKMTGRPFQMFRTRDLSLDGAFVETGPLLVAAEEKIEVALKIPSNGASQVYRFNAHVIRVAPSGVGMVFDQVNTESYTALLECVFGTRPNVTV
jgi:hypothetical protein